MKSKRILSILLALVFVLTLLPAVSAPALAATLISSVSITLDAPAVGAHPDYTAVFPSGAHYYSDAYNNFVFRNDIRWEDLTNGTENMDPNSGVFQAGHVYRVWIYLTAQDGYEFSSSTTAAVNGQTAEASEYGSQLQVKYTFPLLPEEGIVASGSLDNGVFWKLDNQGTLTYFGSGEVNASLTRAEMNYRSLEDVIIEGGITKYDVIYDDNDYDIPKSITAKGHLTDFDVESEYHYGYHIGSRRLSNIYFQGAAPDSISYSSSEEVTIWYDPDMSGWTQELIDQLSQDPNITVKATGSPVITSYGDVGYGEGSPAVVFSVAAEGKGTLSYQWFTRDYGSSIWNEVTAASGKTADYTFTPSRELELYCRVSNHLGSVDSPVMYLRNVILSQPADQTVNAGEEVSFSVQAGGGEWYHLSMVLSGTRFLRMGRGKRKRHFQYLYFYRERAVQRTAVQMPGLRQHRRLLRILAFVSCLQPRRNFDRHIRFRPHHHHPARQQDRGRGGKGHLQGCGLGRRSDLPVAVFQKRHQLDGQGGRHLRLLYRHSQGLL